MAQQQQQQQKVDQQSLIFRPRPVYSNLNPHSSPQPTLSITTTTISNNANTLSPTVDRKEEQDSSFKVPDVQDSSFKVPDVPVLVTKAKKEEDFNINDYLELNNNEPAIEIKRNEKAKEDEEEVAVTSIHVENSVETSEKTKASIYDCPPTIPKANVALQKFLDEFNGVHFDTWWPRVIFQQSSGEYQIMIEGFRRTMDGLQQWHSSIICETRGRRCVVSRSGNLYWLHGNCDENMCSVDLHDRFKDGFKTDWRQYLDDYQRETINKGKNDRKKKLKQSEIVPETIQESSKEKVEERIAKEKKTKKTKAKVLIQKEETNDAEIKEDHFDKKIDTTEDRSRRHTLTSLVEKRKDERNRRSSIAQIKFEWGTGKVEIIDLPEGRGGKSLRSSVKKIESAPLEPETQENDSSSGNVTPKKPRRQTRREKEELQKILYNANEEGEEFDTAESEQVEWTEQEDRILTNLIFQFDPKDANFWQQVADNIPGRSAKQCQTRYQSHFGRRKSEKFQPAKKSKNEDLKFDKLAGKNTLLRKKQLRKLVGDRIAKHQDELFGDEPDATPPRPKLKRKENEDDDDDEAEILKPFDHDSVDHYIAGMKRRKVIGKPRKASMTKAKGQKSSLMLLQISSESEHDDSGEEEDDDNGKREFALDLYAEDS